MKHLILGIETSCDETAASIYSSEEGVLSNVLYSQIEVQKQYGGVVPEIASRSHLEKIQSIIASALESANTPLSDISCIAVTNKPGLPGSLLVGVCFAKSLAWALNKKLIGVNHLEGHIFSACIENDIPFPFLCITASGGHTALYLVEDYGQFTLLGQTLDDAAGEAFDKIAKLLCLQYPGGPLIEQLAKAAHFKDFFHYPRPMPHRLNFSFSGLKTAVLYDLVRRGAYNLEKKEFLQANNTVLKQQIASSLLVCIGDTFEQKIHQAVKENKQVKAIAFVGGVSRNLYLRERIATISSQLKKSFFTPSAQYCTDNAAMIAFVGNYKAQKQEWSGIDLDIY